MEGHSSNFWNDMADQIQCSTRALTQEETAARASKIGPKSVLEALLGHPGAIFPPRQLQEHKKNSKTAFAERAGRTTQTHKGDDTAQADLMGNSPVQSLRQARIEEHMAKHRTCDMEHRGSHFLFMALISYSSTLSQIRSRRLVSSLFQM